MSSRRRKKKGEKEKGKLISDVHQDICVRVMDYVFPCEPPSKREVKRNNGRILRRDSEITEVKVWSIPLPDDEGDITFAEMYTNNGVGYFSFARRSVLDPVDPGQAEDVIRGRLESCHEIWTGGGKVQKKVTLAGVIPKKAMAIQIERRIFREKNRKETAGSA